MTDVSIIGLGQMGARLAELAIASGRRVTVWNRTVGRAEALRGPDLRIAADPAEAIAASPVTVLILADDAAVSMVLADPGITPVLPGRTLVNLGTSDPGAAALFAGQVSEAGGRYLDGAIQAAPAQMGEADTPIFLSGDHKAFAVAEPLLRIFGGGLVQLGEDPAAAANLDLATLSWVYGSYAGFLQGALIAEQTGLDVVRYGELVRMIAPSFGAFFEHQAGVIASDDFTVGESPMRISISAVARILRTSRSLGLNADLPALIDGWLGEAETDGWAGEELAALIKVMRTRAVPGGQTIAAGR